MNYQVALPLSLKCPVSLKRNTDRIDLGDHDHGGPLIIVDDDSSLNLNLMEMLLEVRLMHPSVCSSWIEFAPPHELHAWGMQVAAKKAGLIAPWPWLVRLTGFTRAETVLLPLFLRDCTLIIESDF